MGYGCQPLYQNYTLNQTESFVPQRVALIARGGPLGETGCTPREKMLNAIDQNAVAFLLYNNKTHDKLDSVDPDGEWDVPNAIPGILLYHNDGMTLRTWLEEQLLISKDSADPKFFQRVRVNLTASKRMSVIWEVVLVVVVILLAVSLAISGTLFWQMGRSCAFIRRVIVTQVQVLTPTASPSPIAFDCCVSVSRDHVLAPFCALFALVFGSNLSRP